MNRLCLRCLVTALVVACSLASSATAPAALIIEPVFNRVEGSGQAGNNFPLYDPEFLVDGIAYFTANEPGEVVSYPAGDPPDPELDEFHVWNNTTYEITGFTLRLIGTATETRNPGTIVRGPVDAVWGDANGDTQIGLSDIFATILVSPDGKEIRFEDGLIPIGGRFTDIHLAVSDNPPDLAGIDATFTGNLVPEPTTFVLLAVGLAAAGLLTVRRKLSKRTALVNELICNH